MKFKDHKVTFDICVEEFENVFGRKAKNQDEWEEFCHYAERGLSAQIDWDVLFECTKDEMKED